MTRYSVLGANLDVSRVDALLFWDVMWCWLVTRYQPTPHNIREE